MSMQSNKDYAIVAVYSNRERAERVVRALYSARVPLDRLSLIGSSDPQRLPASAQPVRFGSWGMLSSSTVIYVAGLGQLRTAGFFVSLVNEVRQQLELGASPIGAALLRLGLTQKLARQLDAVISAGCWLVMVRGGRTETARAERFLRLLQGGSLMVCRSDGASAPVAGYVQETYGNRGLPQQTPGVTSI